MIARTSLKTLYNRKTVEKFTKLYALEQKQQKRDSSSSHKDNNRDKDKKQQMTKSTTQKKSHVPDIPSFMPVVNIPVAELAHNAFFSLHRPLLGLSTPRPFLAGDMVGQIKTEEENENIDTAEEALYQYLATLRPFEPPSLDAVKKEETCPTTTTLTVEVDPSYFLNHNTNHNEIADYLTAMQEKLDLLYDERARKFGATTSTMTMKKKMKRSRKRKGFFEKN
ncbi:hypothetical protein [Parasitella parasitica]|uniref:Mitochondrial mRNA-processing protein COX24 C-terminal domain-containing protein n=1 Tax=Parasitella parasitica TaxID=35722 RepID=A0A0B7NF41_9FUNG|nr:hypothetical protein [Parasitella parasitica]